MPINADTIYTQLRSDIRATDDISFKLIGIVPLVSGVGLFALLFGEHAPGGPILIVLSLFAATVTFGLFRWELKNIQMCRFLIGLDSETKKHPKPPQGIDKVHAEKGIYFVTILTWLVLPGLLPQRTELSVSWWIFYLSVAVVIGIGAMYSLKASIKSEGEESNSESMKPGS